MNAVSAYLFIRSSFIDISILEFNVDFTRLYILYKSDQHGRLVVILNKYFCNVQTTDSYSVHKF